MKTPMEAVLLTGHGGYEALEYRTDVPLPQPKAGEVLIRVAAAGVNNTDINTRTAWYSKAVKEGSNAGGTAGFVSAEDSDGSWSGVPLTFPRIQGADVCGRIAQVGEGVAADRIGERVIVRNMLRTYVDNRPFECWTLGSECDGGFAQYTVAPSRETFAVDCDWSDAELASIPCAFSTAENMVHRAAVGAETVLVTGASGGVGSAAVQLARRRGATVIAIAARSKASEVLALGADRVIDRNADLVAELGRDSVDVVLDLVGGPSWPALPELLRRGGRYATSGAIAGPIAEIDLRTLYLKDLTFYGCTFQDDIVFENLVSYIEAGSIRPVVAGTYPLKDIVKAQEDFLAKKHTGKLVLIPSEEHVE
ncbi:alcohol dehydrogenase family protein [Defluviimonas sp. D31]|uniref:alcohol dehydrogenase family protein n=1 Tax=Defluviimonas sp. D31 TaxID=3083253 RepID=UPI00296E781C|nr:alcohol dehydrogenase family protein [Defluviimonas sp. D31]MDW4548915.1 alcohol dehydrogenase family protein [Defluviimonas sp. D31]